MLRSLGGLGVIEQAHDAATFRRKISKEDGAIDFWASRACARLSFACLFSVAGRRLDHGETRIKLGWSGWSSEPSEAEPGTWSQWRAR